MYLKAIENVHHAKTTFLNSFVKDKDLNKSLTELVDTEAQFGKALVKAATDIQLSLNGMFYKPATWLKS
jgi:hypothetical protein